LDVNGDGFINSLDVLNVIDFINSNLNGGRSGEGEAGDTADLWIPAEALDARAAAPAVSSISSSSLSIGGSSGSGSSGSVAWTKSTVRSSDLAMASYFSSSLLSNPSDDSDDLFDSTARSVTTEDSIDDRLDSALSQDLDEILGL
jgi:hypothetical protein